MNENSSSRPAGVPGGDRTLRTAAAALALAAFGFAAGWLGGAVLPRSGAAPGDALELRSGSSRFINPLLECLGDDEGAGFVELRPFQADLERFIAGRTAGGGVADAAVYFRDLNNGPWFGIREQDKFIPASLLKLPIAIAAMKQAERDPSFLSRPVHNDLAGDHTRSQLFRPSRALTPGARYTVEELIEAAITRSDNNAQQLLVRVIDPGVLLAVFRDLGVPAPKLNIQYDFMSTRRYASFFRILFNASYLSRSSSQRLLELLARAEYRGGIAAGTPGHVLVAHKFGEHASPAAGGLLQLHDCGIIYYPDHPYVLCVMTRGSDVAAMEGLIRDASRLVYGSVDGQYRPAPAEVLP